MIAPPRPQHAPIGGNALRSSFVLFVAGAVVLVAWFAFLPAATAVPLSIAASTIALFAIGAAITRVTSRSPWRSGLRQLAIGLAAAAGTYGTGVLLGVSLGT